MSPKVRPICLSEDLKAEPDSAVVIAGFGAVGECRTFVFSWSKELHRGILPGVLPGVKMIIIVCNCCRHRSERAVIFERHRNFSP